MIAIGVRCKCGWGPQDVVPLEDASKFLKNLAYIVAQHYGTCSETPRKRFLTPIHTMSPDEEVEWNPATRPTLAEGRCVGCRHYHELNGGTRRKTRCGFCSCTRVQERFAS